METREKENYHGEVPMSNVRNKNQKLLKSFTKYCEKNPDMRFWQALRNWSGEEFIYAVSASGEGWLWRDTFYREALNK